MARLNQAGAEIDGSLFTAQNAGPDGAAVGTGTLTRDTVVFRSGRASWKYDSGGASGNGTSSAWTPTFVDGRTYFARAYIRFATGAPGATARVLGLDGGNTIAARLRTDGALELYVNGAAQGGPSAVVTGDSLWHMVEVKGVTAATTLWTAAELQVDGASIATWSGSVSRSSDFVAWGWVNETPGPSEVINVDDVALNDSTGAVNNSWCGPGAVVLLSPISDNAKGTGWTNDAATTTNLWDAVNNTPAVGITDTTTGSGLHQLRNATSNANVNYDANMTSYTTAGIVAADRVNAIVPWVATGAPVTTSSKQGTVGLVSNPTIANVALGAAGTAGAFWAGLAAGTFGAGWKWTPMAVTERPTVTLGTSPVMRITQVTASTRIAMICAMFVYVEYTAGPVAGQMLGQPEITTGDEHVQAPHRASLWMRRWEGAVGWWGRRGSGLLTPA